MIVLDLSILNQKGTPMFNSDTFANRPAFGIVGRIFISTDTAAIYRDTGTAWDLIADGGSSSTNIYNSNGTLSANRVVSDGGFGLSFTPTTHIGTATIGGGGSGKLIVGSSTADNGIQIFGANAPSLRIDNAQSGGTQRFIIGLATSTNNFIQGAIASDFCITTASSGAILFGMWQSINASEVMRITTASNLLIGLSVDGGQRFQVQGDAFIKGSGATSATNSLLIQNSSGTNLLRVSNGGFYTLSGSNGLFISMFTTSLGAASISGTNTQFYNYTTTQAATFGAFCFCGDNFTQTSGSVVGLSITKGFEPTSGTASYSMLSLQPNNINQTGGANGITRGLFIQPTITAAVDFRAIEVTKGVSVLAASTTASATLRIPSGTAPTTPVNGDIFFDGTNLFMQVGGVTKTFTLI